MSPEFIQRVETVMKGTGNDEPALTVFLSGLSAVYKAGIGVRNALYKKNLILPKTLPCPVVSVGNITVGGTGKTPLTIFLARKIHERGFKPVILSRGYGGTASQNGGMVSDGVQILMNPSESGDEPFMMANALPGIPVFVGKNRYEAGILALSRFSPDLFILDDGFQHRILRRDLDILLLDNENPFGNGHLLPRGPLREPLTGMERAGVFVLTRSQHHPDDAPRFRDVITPFGMAHKPVFTSSHKPVVRGLLNAGSSLINHDINELIDRRQVFAFSGIANNADFRKGLEQKGFDVKGFMEFPDHHPYNSSDFGRIKTSAAESKSDLMATTLKDMSRIQGKTTFPIDLMIMDVDISFGTAENDFVDMVLMGLGFI